MSILPGSSEVKSDKWHINISTDAMQRLADLKTELIQLEESCSYISRTRELSLLFAAA